MNLYINLPINENMPSKYTCDQEGINPEISWNDFSNVTKSFAFIMEDPDAPLGSFVHWLAVNIPLNIAKIAEGEKIISNTSELPNSSGKVGYIAPCPPSGSHRYTFKIFALNVDYIDGVSKDNFYDKIEPYIIDKAEFVSKYERVKQ